MRKLRKMVRNNLIKRKLFIFLLVLFILILMIKVVIADGSYDQCCTTFCDGSNCGTDGQCLPGYVNCDCASGCALYAGDDGCYACPGAPTVCEGDTPCGSIPYCTAEYTFYKDADGDYYSDGTTETGCTASIGYKLEEYLTALSGDCDDDDYTVNPSAEDICDGKDNDCDGIEEATSGDECLGDTLCCNDDYSEGYCVQGTPDGDSYCRATDPYCGDLYCFEGILEGDVTYETCTSATRKTDVYSCPDDPVCGKYVCEEGCSIEALPAGRYPNEINDQIYPYPEGEWACDESVENGEGGYGKHCDGEGVGESHCVSDCIDEDEDGYGQQPSNLFIAESCPLGSSAIDCNDESEYIYPNDNSLNQPSSYCDCDFNTGGGYTQGTTEGPVNIYIPISQDTCFDGEDNDCDGPADIADPNNLIDCNDEGCREDDDYIYPITNRTCGENSDGLQDCTESYVDELDYDRQCCSSASDCVIDGECVGSAELHGVFPDVHACTQGKWYGGDTYSTVCNWVINDSEYSPDNYSHWGLNGNAGGGKCCGDDLDEYYTEGIDGSFACCDEENMYVLAENCLYTLTEKDTWDGYNIGYCLADTSCLVNPEQDTFDGTVDDATDIDYPLENEIRCINDEEHIGDHYCDAGEWTSRTALIATQLLSFGESFNDMSLYCDSYENVLNHYDYSISGGYAEYYLGVQSYACTMGENTVPCVNNVCVLNYNYDGEDKVILGMSLNHDVDSSVYSVLEVLSGTNRDCNNQLTSDKFLSCGTGVWYNNEIKSVIFSPDSITMGNVLVGEWTSALKNIYGEIFSSIAYRNPSSYDYSFVTDT